MSNLLNSTDIATLFLDDGLVVRRFTPATTNVFKLLPTDVGRPLSDLSTELDYPHIFDDARSVSETLLFREREVATRDGRWFRVRIMPYRTHDNRIDGLVITFTSITAIKELEHDLRAKEARLRQLLHEHETDGPQA
jgi:two-component system CheB/CheR fusion protein